MRIDDAKRILEQFIKGERNSVGDQWGHDMALDAYAALTAELEAARRDAAESERQLALYRKAINRMDDMTEYARPGLTKEQLRAIFAELTRGLARHKEAKNG